MYRVGSSALADLVPGAPDDQTVWIGQVAADAANVDVILVRVVQRRWGLVSDQHIPLKGSNGLFRISDRDWLFGYDGRAD